MDIPFSELSESALRSLIEEYVGSEGTEYGDREVSLETKVGQVLRSLKEGKARITFDPDAETCFIQPIN